MKAILFLVNFIFLLSMVFFATLLFMGGTGFEKILVIALIGWIASWTLLMYEMNSL